MKTCLFDIDGTLIQTGGAGQVAFAQTFADLFRVDEISPGVPFSGRSDRAIAIDLMRAHGIEVDDLNWRTFRTGYAERLPAALRACVGRVLPGVEELIGSLEKRGDVLIGLLTGNLRQTAELKLAYYGLWDRFNFGGFGDDCTDRNDIAAVAVREARRLHAGEGEHTVVVVGDTPHDVTCAHAVGAKAVATLTGGFAAEALLAAAPDLLVDTLEHAAGVLELFDA